MTNLKGFICTVFGILGSLFAQLFGGWSEDMVTLLLLMVADFVMGFIVAGVFHNSNKSENGSLNSRAGWKGLCRKGVTLLFVLVAHRLDVSLNVEYIRTATVIGFILNEIISIIENAGLMGVPFPAVIVRAIEILKLKENGHENN